MKISTIVKLIFEFPVVKCTVLITETKRTHTKDNFLGCLTCCLLPMVLFIMQNGRLMSFIHCRDGVDFFFNGEVATDLYGDEFSTCQHLNYSLIATVSQLSCNCRLGKDLYSRVWIFCLGGGRRRGGELIMLLHINIL